MLFWKFFFVLFVAGFIFRFVYPFVILPLFGFVLLTNRKLLTQGGDGLESPRLSPAGVIGIAVGFLGSAYVVCGWAAWGASLTVHYSQLPDVAHHWLYYVVGGCLCLGALASMEDAENNSPHSLFAMIAFIIFCIWPSLMQWPYGWFLNRIVGNPPVATSPADDAIDRGRAAAAKEDWDSAFTEYTNAIRLDPKRAAAWCGLGTVHAEKHEWDKAIANLSEAIRRAPKYMPAYFQRGCAYLGKGCPSMSLKRAARA